MPPHHITSHDLLLARADRAIADAVEARASTQAGLTMAGRRTIHRIGAGSRPAQPALPEPMPEIEPRWSVAVALAAATAVIREADRELEAAWCRIGPTLQTPRALVKG